MTTQRYITNKYAGPCFYCSKRVRGGEGNAWRWVNPLTGPRQPPSLWRRPLCGPTRAGQRTPMGPEAVVDLTM